jgi:hypothetical protein
MEKICQAIITPKFSGSKNGKTKDTKYSTTASVG